MSSDILGTILSASGQLMRKELIISIILLGIIVISMRLVFGGGKAKYGIGTIVLIFFFGFLLMFPAKIIVVETSVGEKCGGFIISDWQDPDGDGTQDSSFFNWLILPQGTSCPSGIDCKEGHIPIIVALPYSLFSWGVKIISDAVSEVIAQVVGDSQISPSWLFTASALFSGDILTDQAKHTVDLYYDQCVKKWLANGDLSKVALLTAQGDYVFNKIERGSKTNYVMRYRPFCSSSSSWEVKTCQEFWQNYISRVKNMQEPCDGSSFTDKTIWWLVKKRWSIGGGEGGTENTIAGLFSGHIVNSANFFMGWNQNNVGTILSSIGVISRLRENIFGEMYTYEVDRKTSLGMMKAMGKFAGEIIPIIKTLIEGIVLLLAPFILLVSFIGGSFPTSYFKLLGWLALWLPITKTIFLISLIANQGAIPIPTIGNLAEVAEKIEEIYSITAMSLIATLPIFGFVFLHGKRTISSVVETVGRTIYREREIISRTQTTQTIESRSASERLVEKRIHEVKGQDIKGVDITSAKINLQSKVEMRPQEGYIWDISNSHYISDRGEFADVSFLRQENRKNVSVYNTYYELHSSPSQSPPNGSDSTSAAHTTYTHTLEKDSSETYKQDISSYKPASSEIIVKQHADHEIPKQYSMPTEKISLHTHPEAEAQKFPEKIEVRDNTTSYIEGESYKADKKEETTVEVIKRDRLIPVSRKPEEEKLQGVSREQKLQGDVEQDINESDGQNPNYIHVGREGGVKGIMIRAKEEGAQTDDEKNQPDMDSVEKTEVEKASVSSFGNVDVYHTERKKATQSKVNSEISTGAQIRSPEIQMTLSDDKNTNEEIRENKEEQSYIDSEIPHNLPSSSGSGSTDYRPTDTAEGNQGETGVSGGNSPEYRNLIYQIKERDKIIQELRERIFVLENTIQKVLQNRGIGHEKIQNTMQGRGISEERIYVPEKEAEKENISTQNVYRENRDIKQEVYSEEDVGKEQVVSEYASYHVSSEPQMERQKIEIQQKKIETQQEKDLPSTQEKQVEIKRKTSYHSERTPTDRTTKAVEKREYVELSHETKSFETKEAPVQSRVEIEINKQENIRYKPEMNSSSDVQVNKPESRKKIETSDTELKSETERIKDVQSYTVKNVNVNIERERNVQSKVEKYEEIRIDENIKIGKNINSSNIQVNNPEGLQKVETSDMELRNKSEKSKNIQSSTVRNVNMNIEREKNIHDSKVEKYEDIRIDEDIKHKSKA